MDNTINYEQLAQEVRERKEAIPESQQTSHKEILHTVIREQNPQSHTPPPQPGPPDQAGSQGSLPEYAKDAPPDVREQAESLIAYTFQHGLHAGIAKARKADPYVLDLYHDSLVEKLHDELIHRNLLS